MNRPSSLSRLMLGGAAAALVTMSVAAPADARPRWGYPRHDRGIDGGDLLLGAILAGGAILLATGIAGDRDRDRNRSGDRTRDRGYGDGRDRVEREAADMCADEAEREAGRRLSGTRATVEGIERSGDTTYVRGVVTGRNDYGVSGRERWGNRDDERAEQAGFRCSVRFGRIENLALDDRMAWR